MGVIEIQRERGDIVAHIARFGARGKRALLIGGVVGMTRGNFSPATSKFARLAQWVEMPPLPKLATANPLLMRSFNPCASAQMPCTTSAPEFPYRAHIAGNPVDLATRSGSWSVKLTRTRWPPPR